MLLLLDEAVVVGASWRTCALLLTNRRVMTGTFSTEKLREEIIAGNEGVDIPMSMRWIGRPTDIKARAAKD